MQLDWGARAPSRAVVGAFAGHTSESHTFPMEFWDAIGGGADGYTRGACAPRRDALTAVA
jgi:hypothetical protein